MLNIATHMCASTFPLQIVMPTTRVAITVSELKGFTVPPSSVYPPKLEEVQMRRMSLESS
jgi:hypothetical protein